MSSRPRTAKSSSSKSGKKSKKHSPVSDPVLAADKSLDPDLSLIAVIDIGTSSIRLEIAEYTESGELRRIENLQQAVSLGAEAFTQGKFSTPTIETAVAVLKNFRRVLDEYQLTDARKIRCVATSAVREAGNSQAFVDRVWIATSFEVEVIDLAEETRLTYMAVLPVLQQAPWKVKSETIVMEVGGGSTELLLLKGDEVVFSHSYSLGSLRLRERLATHQLTPSSMRQLMESHIQRSIEQIRMQMPLELGSPTLVALGGEARFAAAQLEPDWGLGDSARLSIKAFSKLVSDVSALSPEELVPRYKITFQEAETLVPALLAILMLARDCGCKYIMVTSATMRDGLLAEMVQGADWSSGFAEQIIHSAVMLGRKYEFGEQHARHVASLAGDIFDSLIDEHRLDKRARLLLMLAAILHEIGQFISFSSHHKHSMYLIRYSEIFGLSQRDHVIVSQVARYHRRAAPRLSHEDYSSLDKESRILVSKLAAILRVADSLETAHLQRIRNIECRKEDTRFVISCTGVEDLSLEQMSLATKGKYFESVYGLKVELRPRRRN
jgi:exopolyphosphatase/guanosine-5'-triphosphate,3'-diphosphate pyrophosphatase